MVPIQPGFCNIFELFIFINFLWADVTMVIDDRQILCFLMIQKCSRFIFQEKILAHKLFHMNHPPLFVNVNNFL
ncbi:Uncharacterised protein [Mycobacteroides abscessus subsp. abscessus]|nr:Uncharacterised protein [Mycobacteroides abscessus subsp. abscessus]